MGVTEAGASGWRVAVAGAGPAGMTAALVLARAGARVTVFEAEAGIGGRTRSERLDDCGIDSASQLFGSVYTRFLEVLRLAGAGGLCLRTSGRDALWRAGALHEVVYGSPTSMLASGALPFGLKLKLGAHYLPYLHRHAAALRMHALPAAAAAGLDGESAEAWGRRELGRSFVDLLVSPLLHTLYGCEAEETSAGFYHALARSGMTLEVLALRGGSGAFCAALADAVAKRGGEVRTGTPVTSLAPAGDGVELAGEGWSERFDAAVLAVPAPAARTLLGGALPRWDAWLAPVRVRPTVTVALLLDRPVGTRWFGLSFARGESRALAAVCVQEAKGTGLIPAGRGALLALPLPSAGEGMLELDAQRAVERLLPDLRLPFPRLEAHIRGVRAFRWPHGWTVFRPGYLAHLGRAPAGAEVDRVPVALAGDYLCAPNVEGAVTSGLRAAERLLGYRR